MNAELYKVALAYSVKSEEETNYVKAISQKIGSKCCELDTNQGNGILMQKFFIIAQNEDASKDMVMKGIKIILKGCIDELFDSKYKILVPNRIMSQKILNFGEQLFQENRDAIINALSTTLNNSIPSISKKQEVQTENNKKSEQNLSAKIDSPKLKDKVSA